MNSLVWNCRGLVNPSTVRQLVWLAKHKRPEVIFLMETKLLQEDWCYILPQIGFSKFFSIDCDCVNGGRKGGLCLLWVDDLLVNIKSYSFHHVLASLDDGEHEPWDFCGLYGWSITDEHYLMWELMLSILPQVSDKWICGGDFNETMFHFEKRLGQLKADSRLEKFRETVEVCGLHDLGFLGDPYTWTNNQKEDANIVERLDRIFGSESWMSSFPGFEVYHLLRKSSDHCPLLLCLEKNSEETLNRPKPFRFEAMWLRNDSCKPFCENLWADGSVLTTTEDIRNKIEKMGRELKIWEKNVFGHVRKRCSKIRKDLAELQTVHREATSKDEQKRLEDELDELSKQEELMWKQSGQIGWRKEIEIRGFFTRLLRGGKRGIIFVRFSVRMSLFSAGHTHNPDEVLRSINPVVTEEMNSELSRPYTHTEITQALKQMPPLKAPGPDVNTNRLKSCLPSIISESQFAFVPGRHITDNALLAFEIFHMMKHNKAKVHGVFAFKLDMAKAYDRVEWSFLESIMLHLGFNAPFVDLIMRCVAFVSFRVLVNGFPGNQFEAGRGLRQGDPLSPFLFLFCAEALSGLLRRAETQELLHGARLSRTAPRVSHLLFADDCIIFGRSNVNEIDLVKNIIRDYEGVSGQLVNLEKSSISFSGGVVEERQIELSCRFGVTRSGARSTYLGIPSTIGRSKSEIFQMMIDRTRKKAKDWKRRFLSGAGKMVLIQSILQSIPTYIMSCFALPEQICQQLNSVAARFFWGQKNEERRIHWRSWKKLCTSKGNGGLGFRDISLFNQAMLAKQAWRLILNESSLLARSLKARYHPRNDLLLSSNAHYPSFAWKSILVGRDLLVKGIAWKIGDGARVRIGIDSWLPDGKGQFVTARVEDRHDLLCAKDLMDSDGSRWNNDILNDILKPGDRWKLQAQISIRPNESDKPFWPRGKLNTYSVKSGYNLAVELNLRDEASSSRYLGDLWKWIWKLEVIPKVKMFMWKCLSNCLPTAKALRSRAIEIDGLCRRCGSCDETLEHALRDCGWVSTLWAVSPIRLQPMAQGMEFPIVEWFDKIRSCPHNENKELSHIDVLRIAERALWSKPLCAAAPNHSTPTLSNEGEGVCKIASDAAMKEGSGVGIGAVLRQEDGLLMGCRFGFMRGAFSVVEGEALALLEGLKLCRDKGVREVIAETDCQQLYWMLARQDRDLSYLGDTLEKIHLLKGSFRRLAFSWTPREGNSTADSLASFALSSLCCLSSFDVLPAVVNSTS
ncbi:uncharacterized protein LOC131006452 [Salvia miltiorrhiza]|uniref:uncharacterized protein LOC131006452 n=1 Tax=Salvia miltiorrhiza TaxID=226208 RepID=UPI0025ABDA4E|nr:uncharacterized protein LOC131006452 [Salvia miltiorrhiza]